MKELFDLYLNRASEIIGERTPAEIAYDTVVIQELQKGGSIKNALQQAGSAYPDEALDWTEETIDDIAAYYDYLKNHEEIVLKLKNIPE